MNLKRFIKVTPRDSGKYIVILAANRDFYEAQGAKVEQPTEEEVLAFFPQLKKTEPVKVEKKAQLKAEEPIETKKN
jgi:hypothetical protein